MAKTRTEISEPVLPVGDIQGIAVPGFLKPYQALLGVVYEGTPDAVRSFKNFLGEMAEEVATAAATLEDRRRFRAARKKAAKSPAVSGTLLTAVAFTFPGLLKLTPGAARIPSEAFQLGLAARSAFLGDPTDPADEGNPARWKVGGLKSDIDALFVIAGDTPESVRAGAKKLADRFKAGGLKVSYQEYGGVRPDLPGHEHFGFDDGVSQPGIRGRASSASDDFITERHIDAGEEPAHSLFGFPGQDLVWPGAFVLGQPGSSPDPLIPGPLSPSEPDWTRNGSFLVFRRLRQDVGLFWRTMREEAARLAKLPGFEGMSDESLAARIVGRWPSGAPVNRVPEGDNEALGGDRFANNNIRFDSDGVALPLASGHVDKFPRSKADPAGITCPWAAHIRKVNTRDSGSDTGGRDSTYIRRILRVGVPFGEPIKDRYAEIKDDPQKGARGLLFLSIQASIEDQFEFLVSRWMGDSSRPKMPGGHDLLVGQNDTSGEARVRRCAIFGSGVQQASVSTDAQWIIPTGGGYFFVPSVSALRDVLAR
jgi:Dyp-type peroxidase family